MPPLVRRVMFIDGLYCDKLCLSDTTINCTISAKDPQFHMEIAGGALSKIYQHLAKITSRCVSLSSTLRNPTVECFTDGRWQSAGFTCPYPQEEEPGTPFARWCKYAYLKYVTPHNFLIFYTFVFVSIILIFFMWERVFRILRERRSRPLIRKVKVVKKVKMEAKREVLQKKEEKQQYDI